MSSNLSSGRERRRFVIEFVAVSVGILLLVVTVWAGLLVLALKLAGEW